MKNGFKYVLCVLMAVVLTAGVAVPGFAAVSYMPDVTAQMSNADYWADLAGDADRVLMTKEEIAAQNTDTVIASGTAIIDMHNIPETFDGIARNEMIKNSAKADAEYYYGWIYDDVSGKIADWRFFQKMIDNCIDPKASKEQPMRYGVVVTHTVLQVFPSDKPLMDDPNDPDFSYQAVSSLRVNEPLWIYTTSRDGKYYLARSSSCSGWVSVSDVALCKDKAEWLSAWDIPEDEALVVWGSKVYTDASNTNPETAKRLLTLSTKLRSVERTEMIGLVNNRSAYHNYIVELPVRDAKGYYQKALALIPETADVTEGYMPLTQRNIAKVMLANLGDAYGWGGMMDVEDCSGLVRLVYECFGLSVPRNGNGQWNMTIPKIDMSNMSVEEKCLLLDQLPLGTALCFPGHEMMYLGKADGNYYVVSTVSSIMDPDHSAARLRTRDVMINTLNTRRANGHTWLQDINQAFMIGYGEAQGQSHDFPANLWYHDGVTYCLKNSILTAKTDGYFGVDDTVTRTEAAAALWRMAGKPAAEHGATFADVAPDDDAAAAISWAVETGMMTGYGDGRFGAVDALTREQLAAILYRFAARQGFITETDDSAALRSFRDRSSISTYAREAMEWACAFGILNGANGRLSPRVALTRAQLAVILQRYDAAKAAATAVLPAEAPQI